MASDTKDDGAKKRKLWPDNDLSSELKHTLSGITLSIWGIYSLMLRHWANRSVFVLENTRRSARPAAFDHICAWKQTRARATVNKALLPLLLTEPKTGRTRYPTCTNTILAPLLLCCPWTPSPSNTRPFKMQPRRQLHAHKENGSQSASPAPLPVARASANQSARHGGESFVN